MPSNRAQILISAVDQTKTAFDSIKRGLGGLDELASFRDSLFDPKPIEVKAPKIQADPELLQRLTKPKAAKPAQDTTGAQTTLMKAQLDAEFALLKDGLNRQQTALDAALEDRLVSVRDYYTQKTALEQREVDAEIARKQQELARSQQVATTGKSENERSEVSRGAAERAQSARQNDRLRAKAEVAKAEADLITLNNRRTDIEQANARKAAQAERELADALAQAREELAQITGTATDGDRQVAIERSYRDLRARLAAESDADGVSLVDRLINVKAVQSNLSALEAQWRQVTERLRNAQEAIQTQQQAGLLTEAQARQQIVALQRQSATEMERLLPTMQQAAQAIGPDAVIRVQAWRNELDRTRLTVDEMAPLWNRIGESFGGALNGMITGAQTWRSALASIFQQVADAFLQQIVIQPFQQWIAMQSRMLALKLGFIQQEQTVDAAASAAKVAQKTTETTAVVSMDAAKAGAGAAASQASIPYVGPALAVAAMVAMVAAVMALLGGIKKFAGGGLVSGPGSAISDSIPARLSTGEYVVRAAAVRQVGVAFLDSLNGLSAGPRFKGGDLAFAAGGLVPEVKVPPAQPQMNQAVRIVNAVDPGVTHDHLQSPAGEKVIVNIIGRNARATPLEISMSSTDPNLGLNYGWTLGESGWDTGMDANLKRLGAVVGLSVKDRDLTTPPASPANGDRYIVPAAATGAWAGKTNQIAVRIADAWEYHVPKIGWLCYIEDEAKLSAFKSTGWSAGLAI